MRNFLDPARIVRLVMERVRVQLSYANVMATIAVFIALGGTSYAVVKLPRNSISAKQIRQGAVGKSEVRNRAIRSRHINDGSVAVRDLSSASKSTLAGPPGPPGPPGTVADLGAAVSSGGGLRHGKGVEGVSHEGSSGLYDVRFNRDLAYCLAVASVADVEGGIITRPENGEIVTRVEGRSVFVRTRNSSGAPTDLPFHLIVVC